VASSALPSTVRSENSCSRRAGLSGSISIIFNPRCASASASRAARMRLASCAAMRKYSAARAYSRAASQSAASSCATLVRCSP
jgi:hypothetical protein